MNKRGQISGWGGDAVGSYESEESKGVVKGTVRDVKKTVSIISTATRALIFIGIAFAVIILAIWLAPKVPQVATETTTTPINIPSPFKQILQAILGIGDPITGESLAIFLAIFAIIFFAISDILSVFSLFSETVSYIIGFGIASIAGATKITGQIAILFGFTAGIGALGIAVIVIAAIVAAVILQVGIGAKLREWALNRQLAIETIKTKRGTEELKEGIYALKGVARETKAGEKGR